MSPKAIMKTAIFKGKDIRRVLVEEEWWFSVVDICSILTDSPDPGAYWRKLKQRLKNEGSEVVTFCHGLKLPAPDGKMRESDCVNTEGAFRIIQSIPSPKAEPFKRWLARVGKERIDEIENPELGMQRTKALYEKKGYPKGWIEKRLRGIAVREKLTDEWDARGAEADLDYAVLTNEILQGAFDMRAEEYKKHKGLERQNLRDHMTDLELIITMLGEAATTKITVDRDSQGIPALKKDAQEGGEVAGKTRKDIESRTGIPIVSKSNFLPHKRVKKISH